MIRALGLGLSRGGRELLADIDLELHRGEHWILWGPSGAGKTSLARVLAGLDAPASGRIEFAEAGPHPMLFQDPDAQLAAASVRDEIALGARDPHEGPAGVRVDEALRRFGLSSLAGRNPHSLSLGEKRRLGLAALSVLDSDILVLDEPESHLDETGWRDCLRYLEAWRAGAPRLLIEISRDPERALAADGVILLRKGRLLAAGALRSLYARFRAPDLPRVAALEDEETAATTWSPREAGGVLIRASGLGLDLPGGAPLLDGIDLELRRGERVLLGGDNGCGKSTLLLLLADLADPDRGRIHRREGMETGLALQDPERSFFAETVEEEIAFAPSRRGLSGEALEARIAAALEAVGLPDSLRARDPISLSAGEMRRLVLAGLFALEPDFLFLDEPAAGLDPLAVEKLVEALLASGLGFLWADSRVPRELEERFDRRYTLSEGKLTEALP